MAPILWDGALAVEIAYVLVSLALIRAPLAIYLRLAAAPLFVLWKLGVYVRMAIAFRRGTSGEWVRTARHAMRKDE